MSYSAANGAPPPPPRPPQAPNPQVTQEAMLNYQKMKDAEHIKLLSIFHYIYAGLLAVGTLWPLIYVAMGLMIVSIPVPASSPSSPAPALAPSAGPVSPGSGTPSTSAARSSSSTAPAAPVAGSFGSSSASSSEMDPKIMGWIFFGIGVAMAIGFLTMALLNFFCGRFFSARRRRMFLLVVSGINAMVFPIGTAVGVFSIIVLLRPSVEDLFEGRSEAVGLH